MYEIIIGRSPRAGSHLFGTPPSGYLKVDATTLDKEEEEKNFGLLNFNVGDNVVIDTTHQRNYNSLLIIGTATRVIKHFARKSVD